MPIRTAILTHHTRTTLDTEVTSLYDTMVIAQERLGQITWDTITPMFAAGIYQSENDPEAHVAVVDLSTADDDHLAVITLWTNKATVPVTTD